MLEEPHRGHVDLVDPLDIPVQGFPLRREALAQAVHEPLTAGPDVVLAVGEDEAVVVRRHRGPREAAVADVLEEEVRQRSVGLELSDVVNAHVPLVTLAPEGVSEASHDVVPLENQHPSTGLREESGSGEAAHARADDDGVEATFSARSGR